MDHNLNTLGCADLISSPDLTNPDDCPSWETAYWFEVCYSSDVLGISSLQDVTVSFPYLHASPAKCVAGDTIQGITPAACN